MLEHALKYAARGWRVLPLRARGKLPANKHGSTDATTDAEQIRKWWGMWPDANIGIATGHGLVVLDIDGTEGEVVLKSQGHETGDSLQVRTARGRHVYYSGGEGLRNWAGKLPQVDLRGQGGYVVAPPSVHETGHVYEFDDDDAEVEPVPGWIVDLAAQKQKRATLPTGEHDEIAKGTRNDTIYRIACKYRADGYSARKIRAMIGVDNERCNPPLDDGELDSLATNAAKHDPSDAAVIQATGIDPEVAKILKAEGFAPEKVDRAVAKVNEKTGIAATREAGEIDVSLVRYAVLDDAGEVVRGRGSTFSMIIGRGGDVAVLMGLSGDDVLSHKKIEGLALEAGVMLPTIKRDKWKGIIGAALANATIEARPVEGDIVGMIQAVIVDWISELEPTSSADEWHTSRHMMRLEVDGEVYVSGAAMRSKIRIDVGNEAKVKDIGIAYTQMLITDALTPAKAGGKRYKVKRCTDVPLL